MSAFFHSLGIRARFALLSGVTLIVLGVAAAGWWLLKPDYQVLFSELKPQDSAVMAAELDKLKIPYHVEDGGATLLVDRAQVHATRMKLMGRELPLHGVVGLEVFNNTDFGMTEFAQKINYQRALQGELTRTVLSLSEIRDVRVHLALPEQGLFKQAASKPKAAITITLRDGQSLRPEQISGIQRLVASATPGMLPQDVTVVDRQGVALSRSGDEAPESPSGGSASRLELKKETEAQLARKAMAVLEKAFGAGEALASVDVTLNMDHVRTTTEDVLPAGNRAGEGSRGVLVRERETVRDAGAAPLDAARGAAVGGGSSQREADYQTGRRVEQVVSVAGAIRRVQVVAVVKRPLDAAQEEKVRQVVAAAVGAQSERGDTVVVQSLAAWAPAAEATRGFAPAPSQGSALAAPSPARQPAVPAAMGWQSPAAALLVALLGLGLFVFAARRRAASTSPQSPALSDAERTAALARLQDWLSASPPASAPDIATREGGRP